MLIKCYVMLIKGEIAFKNSEQIKNRYFNWIYSTITIKYLYNIKKQIMINWIRIDTSDI